MAPIPQDDYEPQPRTQNWSLQLPYIYKHLQHIRSTRQIHLGAEMLCEHTNLLDLLQKCV